MSVTLRKRLKNNKVSLYLDIYSNGVRSYEYLKLYLYQENGNLSKQTKEENKKTIELAETLRSKRHYEIQTIGSNNSIVINKFTDFISFFKDLKDKKTSSAGSYNTWVTSFNLFANFFANNLPWSQVNYNNISRFKEHLDNTKSTKNGHILFSSSRNSYLSCLKSALKKAYKAGYLNVDLSVDLGGYKKIPSHREFLTASELKKLMVTKCDIDRLKDAFLFSCFTGLRWSDIVSLNYDNVIMDDKGNHYIKIKIKKTKESEMLPVSKQALKYLSHTPSKNNKYFDGLYYSAWLNLKLGQWILRAEIKKTITFHCARHTFATLQLSAGTDIYTLSKLLGHSDVKTTSVYTKIIDTDKLKAMNKITVK